MNGVDYVVLFDVATQTPAFNSPLMFSGIESGSRLRVSYVAGRDGRHDVLRLEIAKR